MFEIIFKILVLSILIVLFLCVMELRRSLCGNDRPTQNIVKRLFNNKKPTKEQQRINQIIGNIDNYNGDSLGQREIEVK